MKANIILLNALVAPARNIFWSHKKMEGYSGHKGALSRHLGTGMVSIVRASAQQWDL